MSLAQDILKRTTADLSPAPKKSREVSIVANTYVKAARKKKQKRPPVRYTPPGHTAVKGVHWMYDRRMWRTCFCYRTRVIVVGIFPTQARASVAYRLYAHWVKSGLGLAPSKPDKRLYTKRDALRNRPT